MKNFKKVISAVIALAMAASSFVTVSASSFTDVADTAAYAEAVEVLTSLGIVSGYAEEDGSYTFKPEGQITRAEAATMIVGALNMTEDAKANSATTQFTDVNESAAWAAGYVNVGVAQGFIKGMDATTFAPQENVTYAQMCVMLTTIAGYGEYAQASSTGGWASGYTSMAASTGINKGVAVADDTALTRGQVAMMIYNTLVTPKLGVAEYSLTGNTYSQLDGQNNRDFVTLLSEKFGGYIATVTITSTPLTGLENDEVIFTVTKADWWPAIDSKIPNTAYPNGKSNEKTYTAGINVNGELLQTGKAVFVENEDDELVMIYFKASGRTETKELEADTYVKQDDLSTTNRYDASGKKLRFGNTYYKMDDVVDIYVNGAAFADVDSNITTSHPATDYADEIDVLDEVLKNAVGTVKMVKDETSNKYDTIFVDYYQIAEVSSVGYSRNETTINLRKIKSLVTGTGENIDEIVITDEGIEENEVVVTVTRNGADAELSSLVKGDVIAYAVDFKAALSRSLTNPKKIDIIATNEVVNGQIAAVDTDDNIYTIGDKTYATVDGNAIAETLKDTITAQLDPFGRIFATEKDGTADKYGIFVRETTDGSIQLMLADGTYKSYEPKSGLAITQDGTGSVNLTTKAAAPIYQRVAKYTVKNSTGELTALDFITGTNFDAEYKTRTNKLGGATILSTTPMFDVSDTGVAYNRTSDFETYSPDLLTNDVNYKGYSFVESGSTYTNLVLITKIGSTFGDTSSFAVIKRGGQWDVTEDEDDAYVVTAMYEGEEIGLNFVSATAAADLKEGDVIFFELDSDGFVKRFFEVFDKETGVFTNLVNAITPKLVSGETIYDVLSESAPNVIDWDFTIDNVNNKTVQFIDTVVVDVTSSTIALAKNVSPLTVINKNLDYAAGTAEEGVEFFGISDDTYAYTYDINSDEAKEYNKYDITDVTSVAPSKLDRYEGTGANKGIYDIANVTGATSMNGDANRAIAMIVDGDVTAIYVLER